jgi:hypothetical protein
MPVNGLCEVMVENHVIAYNIRQGSLKKGAYLVLYYHHRISLLLGTPLFVVMLVQRGHRLELLDRQNFTSHVA